MKLTHGFAALALLTTAAAAHAEFSGTLTATTDYDWRGVTQTAQDPALQGSIDFAAENGFNAGVWASNVDFGSGDPNVEIDLYAGWGGGDELPWGVGIVYYTYPGESSFNFPEVWGSLGYKWVTGKISYSWDFAGTSETAFYYEGNVEIPLPAEFTFLGHIGYSDGDGIEAAYGQDNYVDWSAGLGYTWGHFDFALKWVDGSDLETLDGTPNDISSTESRAIFSVSTSFPWSSAEPVGGETAAKDAAQ